MLLSIVITTFNRSGLLKALLEHLRHQSDPEFQVVVAIDGSTDDTEAVLREIQVPYDLKWVNTGYKGYGLAIARNMGILASDGEMVAIIDDDCFPVEDYVASYKSSVESRTITAGPRDPADQSELRQLEKMRELGRLPPQQAIEIPILREKWPKAVTTECNICMLKADLIKMGLFSERMRIYGFIGQEFFARAIHLGYKYKYNPEAGVVHTRQPIGDNGLTFNRKKVEILIATALNPSFFTERQFQLQIDWAKRRAVSEKPAPLPGFPVSAMIAFPFRFLRNRAGDVRRFIRDRRLAQGAG